jgi:hypothetical protein
LPLSTSKAPPSSPPFTPPISATGAGDPHLIGGDGDKFDFKGENGVVYALLSTMTLAVNAFFQHDKYSLGDKTVHGSFMTACYVTARTKSSTVTVSFNATNPSVAIVTIRDATLRHVAMSISSFSVNEIGIDSIEHDNLRMSLSKDHANHASLLIMNGEWEVSAVARLFPYNSQNNNKKRLDLTFKPTSDSAVAPHGLIGQTFDGDNIAVDGAQDDYSGKTVVTKAMGEGAIEGIASDYAVDSPFSTNFKFSRFGTIKASPRDVSKLDGLKRAISKSAVAGAYNDKA